MTFLRDMIDGTWLVLADAAPWLLVSYTLAGIMHEFVSPEHLQRHLGNRRLSSLIKATLSGMFLPVCSCGAIPLGLSLYYSGAYLGPSLAFMVASPMINPAAIFLAYGLLGPKIATIYVAGGLVIPILVGLAGNAWGGAQLHIQGADASSRVQLQSAGPVTVRDRVVAGLQYGFGDLGIVVSKYVVIGALSAGVLFALVPTSFIDRYLGDPGVISLLGVGVLGASMYVCAVGHIPFIAAIVGAGAAPGIAITFLMAGAATNLPEFIAISKLIGKRTAILYSVTVVFFAFVLGWIANVTIGPGFVPVIDPQRNLGVIKIANFFIVSVPPWLQILSAVVVVGLGALAYRARFTQFFVTRSGRAVL